MAEQGLITPMTEKKADGREVSRNTVLRRFAGRQVRVIQFNLGLLSQVSDSIEDLEDEAEGQYRPAPSNPQTSMEQWTEVDADDDLPF